MGTLFFILLAISFPIFYIYGISKFIQGLIKKTTTNFSREQLLRNFIPELKALIARSPNKKVSELLKSYELELKGRNSETVEEDNEGLEVISAQPEIEKRTIVKQAPVEDLWSNWYSHNSINLLLYIGAFLIVSSAAVFVGFQWSVLDGVTKSMVLSLMTALFFGFGIWFYTIDKIKNAGATFASIGSLLIPICGAAWYNFALKDSGVSLGFVWLVTSLVMIGTYVALALFMKSRFFTYSASIGTLSLTLSLINISGINREFYILGSMLSAYFLLIGRIFIKSTDQQIKDQFITPLEVSAGIIMPLSLLYGFTIASSEGLILSVEATSSVLLAATYYLLNYYYFKKEIYLAVAQILFPISLVLYFGSQKIDGVPIFYFINLFSLIYILSSYFLKKSKKFNASSVSMTIGLLYSLLAFFFSYSSNIDPIHHALLAFLPGVWAAVIAYIRWDIRLGFISTMSVAMTAYLFIFDVINPQNQELILGSIYLVMAIIYYGIMVIYKHRLNYIPTFGASLIIYLALAILVNMANANFVLITTLTIAIISFLASIHLEQNNYIYLSNVFLFLSLLHGLRISSLSTEWYPIVFAAGSYLFYFAKYILPEETANYYKNSGLVGSIITPLFYGTTSSFSTDLTQRNSLITAYAASFLYGWEALAGQIHNFGYLASIVAMLTYFWQIHFLNYNEVQLYTLPFGVYLMTLAYFRKQSGDNDAGSLLDIFGMVVLLASSLLQSFDTGGEKYAILLAVEGIALLGLGITANHKNYTYAGIFGIIMAVISQTYSYVFALPKWLIMAIGGLIFLIVAISLMLNRKEESSESDKSE